MPPPLVKRCPVNRRVRYFDPCPKFEVGKLPEGAEIRLVDGGFYVVDQLTGIRYRRITMADLPKHVVWNTRGPAAKDEDE